MKSSQAILLTTLTTLLILLQSFSIPANANDTNSVTFSLTIQNYHGSPLKDVKVQLINSTGDVVDSGTSGSDGKVTLTGWKNETYTLKAIYLGREVGSVENLNCTSPPKTIRVGVFNVKIRIMSYGGLDPVPNAKVNITSSETTPKVDKRKVTDSNGYVVFENLPNGTTYRVDIKYEDKLAVTDSKEINLSDKYEFTLTLNLYRLTLRLKDSSQLPVKGRCSEAVERAGDRRAIRFCTVWG